MTYDMKYEYQTGAGLCAGLLARKYFEVVSSLFKSISL